MSLPQNMASSIAELARLADEMWYLAGDTSADFSWYTKRATLSAVYASTGTSTWKQPLIRRGLYDDGQLSRFRGYLGWDSFYFDANTQNFSTED